MIKLYRGELREEAEEICIFKLDSLGPAQLLKKLIENQEVAFHNFEDTLLNKKYYFTIQSQNPTLSSDFPPLNFLEDLEQLFPQIIWTKIIKSPSQGYKVEFIPVSFYNSRREEEDGVLADCLEEMGYHASNLIPTFRDKVHGVFNKYEGGVYKGPPSFESGVKKEAKEEKIEPYVKETDALLSRLKNLQEVVKTQKKQDKPVQGKKKEDFESQSQVNHRTKKRSKIKILGYVFGGLTFIGLLFVVLFQFYGIRSIEGDSMEPTLKNKQVVFLEKHPSQLKRQDVLAFRVPQMANKEFVKRAIALPGDSVYASDGKLYVNGSQVSTSYTEPVTEDFTLKEISGRDTVPEGKIFVLGDNRAHSTDSRSYGFIDQKEIEGKVIMR